MTEQPLKKTCSACGKDLPATTEFFFSSYLEPGGKNACKACHKKHARNSHPPMHHVQLLERATLIPPEQVPLYKSLKSIVKAIGLSVTFVEHDILDRNLPVYTFMYNNTGLALALRMEDANAYIQEHAQDGYIPTVAPKKPVPPLETVERSSLPPDLEHIEPGSNSLDQQTLRVVEAETKKPEIMGNPDTCGSCKNSRGNILAVRNTDQQVVAYLCSTCYRAAKSFDWEPEQLRAVAKLIETVGGNIDRSRR